MPVKKLNISYSTLKKWFNKKKHSHNEEELFLKFITSFSVEDCFDIIVWTVYCNDMDLSPRKFINTLSNHSSNLPSLKYFVNDTKQNTIKDKWDEIFQEVYKGIIK